MDSKKHDHAHNGDNSKVGYYARRIMAIKDVLVDKGLLTEDELRYKLETQWKRSPFDGSKVIARAWVDASYKKLLIDDTRSALAELNLTYTTASELVIVENTELLHHIIVCTLCSCYPTALLGPPPDWYKSSVYRSRVVIDPRGVMREFGLNLSIDTEVRVMDSTADVRYMVLPRRPSGTEHFTEEELCNLVTRDSMIGVADPIIPHASPV